MELKVCIRALADIQQINRCKETLAASENSISTFSNLLSLSGNQVRFKILYLLYLEKELCVCDLSDILNMNISAISQHLRKLKDGNIIDVRIEGQTYYYCLHRGQVQLFKQLFNLLNHEN